MNSSGICAVFGLDLHRQCRAELHGVRRQAAPLLARLKAHVAAEDTSPKGESAGTVRSIVQVTGSFV